MVVRLEQERLAKGRDRKDLPFIRGSTLEGGLAAREAVKGGLGGEKIGVHRGKLRTLRTRGGGLEGVSLIREICLRGTSL